MIKRLLVVAVVAGAAGLAGCVSALPPSRPYAPAVNPPPPVPDVQVTYTCKSGRTIKALYQTEKATLNFDDQRHWMAISPSYEDSRYVDDKLEWWTTGTAAGDKGTLYAHESDGRTGAVLDDCVVPYGEGR